MIYIHVNKKQDTSGKYLKCLGLVMPFLLPYNLFIKYKLVFLPKIPILNAFTTEDSHM